MQNIMPLFFNSILFYYIQDAVNSYNYSFYSTAMKLRITSSSCVCFLMYRCDANIVSTCYLERCNCFRNKI